MYIFGSIELVFLGLWNETKQNIVINDFRHSNQTDSNTIIDIWHMIYNKFNKDQIIDEDNYCMYHSDHGYYSQSGKSQIDYQWSQRLETWLDSWTKGWRYSIIIRYIHRY